MLIATSVLMILSVFFSHSF